MSKIGQATAWMENIAGDPAHGYDQTYRWGEQGDYDCSSAVITAWETAGVPVKATGATYTGNMYEVFLACGFVDVTRSVTLSSGGGLQRGDVLLNHAKHTAMYCGDGQTVEASINELGRATGGQPGDQTGREFYKRPYRNYPWDCVLRYNEGDNVPILGTTEDLPQPDGLPPRVLVAGDRGAAVSLLQALLVYYGYLPSLRDIDGDFGARTRLAVMGYQAEQGMIGDGICGRETWLKLLGR